MSPFYGWGSTASRLEPLPGDSLLFTTKSLEIPVFPRNLLLVSLHLRLFSVSYFHMSLSYSEMFWYILYN